MPSSRPPESLPPSQRDRIDPMSDDAMAALFDRVAAATFNDEPTWRERLQELPTTTRRLAVVFASLGAAALTIAVQGVRTGLGSPASTSVLVACLVVMSVGIFAATMALQAMHRPAWPRALAVATLLLVLPAIDAVFHLTDMPGMGGPVPWSAHLTCGLGTLVPAAFTGLIVTVFDRQPEPAAWRVVAAAAAGGLIGYASQALHCPATDTVHLLVSHASAGLITGALLVLLHRVRRR